MVAACTAGKGRVKVDLFVGKIFMLRDLTTKTTNISPTPGITRHTVSAIVVCMYLESRCVETTSLRAGSNTQHTASVQGLLRLEGQAKHVL